MKCENRRVNTSFDLPIPGVDDRYYSMPTLLKAFRSATIRDPDTAVKMGREMVASRYAPGELAYARFLRTGAGISISYTVRFRTAEMILRHLDRILDIPPELEAEVAMELAELYEVKRPVGALAALLRAHRLGAEIPTERLERCRKAVLRTVDVNHLGDDPEDAYALAVELDRLGNTPEFTEVFYKLAYEESGSNKLLKGVAALDLAEFYERNQPRSSSVFYRAAREYGFPDVVI